MSGNYSDIGDAGTDSATGSGSFGLVGCSATGQTVVAAVEYSFGAFDIGAVASSYYNRKAAMPLFLDHIRILTTKIKDSSTTSPLLGSNS